MESAVGHSNTVDFDDSELYLLVARFLEASPCQEAAKVLKDELAAQRLLPTSKNWEGEERQLSFEEAVKGTAHVPANYLQLLCSKLLSLLEHHGYQRTAGLHSLLGAGTSAFVARADLEARSEVLTSPSHQKLTMAFREQPVASVCQLVSVRQITPSFGNALINPQFYKNLKLHRSILGHLAPMFCVLFDHTGHCIITGADDELVKIWSSRTGQLLATLRGHSAEVTDLSLSVDNAMIASGSLDKVVRVWCAQTSAPIAILTGHQGHITSVQFSPSPIEEYRYLASTGKDGFLCFWHWDAESSKFNTSPTKFMEKNRMGDQTLCSAFSPGGKYFVTGGTDRIIRVYVCIPGPPILQAELTGHTDRIMTVQFGNTGECLATASCDGTARIWRYREGEWASTCLPIPEKEFSRMSAETARTGKPEKPQVTMIGWEKTDTYLLTAFSPDCIVRVFRSRDGLLVHKLKAHTGEVFVLEAHPIDSRIFLTAGHDGLVIIWDILAGVEVKRFQLEYEEEGIPCIFDCKFSPDGLMCAAADSSCYLSVFGFGSGKPYQQHPQEQFFHTDYRPLMRDRNHFVVDEQSQLPPHLLPPPYLVDIDGHAHPARYQEAIVRLIKPVKLDKQERSVEESEDYDEYMRKRLAQVKKHSFGFSATRWSLPSRNERSYQPSTLPESDVSQAIASNAAVDDPLHVALEHNYAGSSMGEGSGVATTGDSCHPQPRGSQFLSPVQHRGVVTAVVLDGGPSSRTRSQSEGNAGIHAGTDTARMGAQAPSRRFSLNERAHGLDVSLDCSNSTSGQELPPVVNGGEAGLTARNDGSFLPHSSKNLQSDDTQPQAVPTSGAESRAPLAPSPSGNGNRTRGEIEEIIVDVTEDSGSDQNIPNMLSSLVYSLGLSDSEAKQWISFWHNRTIVPPLDPSHLRCEEARRRQIYEEEERNHEEQSRRIQVPCTPSPPPLSSRGLRGHELRSGRTLPDPSERVRVSSVESEGGESDGVESEMEELWEEESTASSDISDWTNEAGFKFVSPVRKRTKRRQQQRSMKEGSGSSEGEGEGEEPGPSSKDRERRGSEKSKEKIPKKRKPPVKLVDYTAYWPPDWLKQTKPQITPYFPQVGDIVVYFRQGHELYVNAVKEQRVYGCKQQKMPWQKYNLLPQEFCQVKNVHFVVGPPPTLCSITLALLSPPSSGSEGPGPSEGERITFTFKYHDMDGVLDFHVLESVYKASIRHQWQAGDRFRSLIDGTYWYGTMLSRQPFSEDLPNSFWQCFHVLWDDGATDQLSPWDMEPLPHDGEDLDFSVRAAELLTGSEDMVEAWGGEGERERIMGGLEVVSRMEEAVMFVSAVDLEEEPTYCLAVPFPTDLSTIQERLQNSFYRRKIALLWEVVQLARNAVAYNEEDSLIVKHSRVLVHTLCKFITSPHCTDPQECYQPEVVGEVEEEVEVMVPEVEFLASEDVFPPIHDANEPANERDSPTRKRVRRVSSDESSKDVKPLALWVPKAEALLDKLVENENSPPFLQPVDTEEYTDYLLVIHHPMDLSTVRHLLLGGKYAIPHDLISDVRLIFQNAKTYNRKGSEIYKMTTELQSFFETYVLDFLKSCQEGGETVHATRRTLGRLAHSSGIEDGVGSTASMESVSSTVSRQSRAGGDEEEEMSENESVGISTPTTPRSESSVRETRSAKRARMEGFTMTLRSRERPKRVLEDSESEEEEEPQRRTRGRLGRTLRKRPRVSSDSDEDSIEMLLYPAVVTTSRGRLVKPTSRFS